MGGVHRPMGTVWLLLFPSVSMFVLGSQNANYLHGPKLSSSLKMLWDGIFLFFFFFFEGGGGRGKGEEGDVGQDVPITSGIPMSSI